MSDVARRAGVSPMTVSNVINGRAQRVSEQTRLRVLATIDELGYQVNMTARNLRMGRTGAVGLAVPAFAPGYYAQLAQRLADRFETLMVVQSVLSELAAFNTSSVADLLGSDAEAAGTWQQVLANDTTSPLVQRLAIEAWLRADRPAAAAP